MLIQGLRLLRVATIPRIKLLVLLLVLYHTVSYHQLNAVLRRLLSLHQNSLSSTIPTGLGQLTRLVCVARASALQFFASRIAVWAELGGDCPVYYILVRGRSLQLYNNVLVGPIPPGIGLLTGLQLLYLQSCRLNGTLPSEISALTRLTYVWHLPARRPPLASWRLITSCMHQSVCLCWLPLQCDVCGWQFPGRVLS